MTQKWHLSRLNLISLFLFFFSLSEREEQPLNRNIFILLLLCQLPSQSQPWRGKIRHAATHRRFWISRPTSRAGCKATWQKPPKLLWKIPSSSSLPPLKHHLSLYFPSTSLRIASSYMLLINTATQTISLPAFRSLWWWTQNLREGRKLIPSAMNNLKSNPEWWRW